MARSPKVHYFWLESVIEGDGVMKFSRFPEEWIIGNRKEQGAGR